MSCRTCFGTGTHRRFAPDFPCPSCGAVVPARAAEESTLEVRERELRHMAATLSEALDWIRLVVTSPDSYNPDALVAFLDRVTK